MTNCSNCGDDISKMKYSSERKYCSKICEQKYNRRKRKSPSEHLPTGTTGAMSELRCCADLLLKEFEVFRSVSPNCSCDIIALKNGKFIRIEVRTAKRGIKDPDKIYCPRRYSKNYDVLACILPEEIVYQPDVIK